MKKNKINKIIFLGTFFTLAFTPFLSHAATLLCKLGPKPTLGVLLNYLTCLISGSVIPLLFALAMVLFIWGIVQYVINTDDESKKKKGKDFMIWGIIALAVMTSVWGLVGILRNTFGIKTNIVPQLGTDKNNTKNNASSNNNSFRGQFTPKSTGGGILPDMTNEDPFVAPSA